MAEGKTATDSSQRRVGATRWHRSVRKRWLPGHHWTCLQLVDSLLGIGAVLRSPAKPVYSDAFAPQSRADRGAAVSADRRRSVAGGRDGQPGSVDDELAAVAELIESAVGGAGGQARRPADT